MKHIIHPIALFLLSLAVLTLSGCVEPTFTGEEVPLDSLCVDTAPDTEPIVILLEHSETEESLVGHYVKELENRLEALDEGFQVTVYADSALSGDFSTSDRMLQGNEIQIKISGGPYGTQLEPLRFPSLSGLNRAELARVMENEELRAYLDEACRELGIVYLGQFPSVSYAVSSKEPIHSVDDFEDLNIRLMYTGSRMGFWNALKAKPVSIALAETLPALQKGQFNASANNSILNIAAFEFYWEDGFVTCTDHEIYTRPVYVNETFWNGLTPGQQTAIAETLDAVCRQAAEEEPFWQAAAVAKLKAEGITILDFPQEEKERMWALTRDAVYEAMCAVYGKEHVDYLLSFVPQA